jgi:hypothetical protein
VRGRYGFGAVAGGITPSDGARAAADAWVRDNPMYGTKTLVPWQLAQDGSTVVAPTDNGQQVTFGFGRGVLAAFPPSIGIVMEVAPVAVQPPPVSTVSPPFIVAPVVAQAAQAAAQAANGAVVVPSAVPGEPQVVAPSMEESRTVPTVVTAVGAAATPALSTGALIALAIGAFFLLRKL